MMRVSNYNNKGEKGRKVGTCTGTDRKASINNQADVAQQEEGEGWTGVLPASA
jgi:hypothetical protein